MKILLLIFFCFSYQSNAASVSALLLDSSFPPLKENGFKLSQAACNLLEENNAEVPAKGDCYETETWKGLTKVNEKLLKGLMDSLAKLDSPEAKFFATYQVDHPVETKKTKVDYILSTHGTRSASLLSGSELSIKL